MERGALETVFDSAQKMLASGLIDVSVSIWRRDGHKQLSKHDDKITKDIMEASLAVNSEQVNQSISRTFYKVRI